MPFWSWGSSDPVIVSNGNVLWTSRSFRFLARMNVAFVLLSSRRMVFAGCMAAWPHGRMAAWLHGCMAAWPHGRMATWLHGYMAAWLHGCMAAISKSELWPGSQAAGTTFRLTLTLWTILKRRNKIKMLTTCVRYLREKELSPKDDPPLPELKITTAEISWWTLGEKRNAKEANPASSLNSLLTLIKESQIY